MYVLVAAAKNEEAGIQENLNNTKWNRPPAIVKP